LGNRLRRVHRFTRVLSGTVRLRVGKQEKGLDQYRALMAHLTQGTVTSSGRETSVPQTVAGVEDNSTADLSS
jgi:hypothetical protein